MKKPGFAAYTDALKSVYGLVGSVGVLVPAIAPFLSTYPPPPRAATAPLTSALAAAALIGTYYYATKQDTRADAKLPPLVKRALFSLSISVLLLIVYIRVLNLLTVETRDGLRFQIGFYTAEWGLTSKGLAARAADPEGTPYRWLLDDGLLHSQGPSELWLWWAIDLSALTTFALFALTFMLWSHGWALLAKQRAQDGDFDGEASPGEPPVDGAAAGQEIPPEVQVHAEPHP